MRRSTLALLATLGSMAPLACQGPLCDVTSCDIRQRECQQRLARAAACLLDEPAITIPVATITRSQLRVSAIDDVNDSDLDYQQLRLDGLALLHLARPGITPQGAANAQTDFVGAFYDRRRKGITVIVADNNDRALDGEYATILIHEFTHALQDSLGRLDFPRADNDNSYDRFLARGALVEGEASLMESRAMLALTGHDAYDIPWPRLLDYLQDESTLWAARSPVPIDFAYPAFVYSYGLSLLQATYRDGRIPGLRALWEIPPRTSLEILQPAAEPSATEDLGDEAVPALPSNYSFLDGGRQGAFLFRILLRRVSELAPEPLTDAQVATMSTQLRGDYLSIFRIKSTEAPISDQVFAAWRLRFVDRSAALAAATYLQSLPLGGTSTLLADRDVILVGQNLLPLPDLSRWQKRPWQAASIAMPPGAGGWNDPTRIFCHSGALTRVPFAPKE